MTSGRVGGEGGYKSVRLFYFLAVTELPGPAAGFNGAGPGGEAASEEQGWGSGGGGSSRQGRGLWGAPLALLRGLCINSTTVLFHVSPSDD